MSAATLEHVLERMENLEELMNRVMTAIEQQSTAERFRIERTWYTVQEFAQLVGEKEDTIRKRCKSGRYQLDAHVPGHRIRIHYSHLLEHLESQGKSVQVMLKKIKKLKSA